jgi:hypothetical protein
MLELVSCFSEAESNAPAYACAILSTNLAVWLMQMTLNLSVNEPYLVLRIFIAQKIHLNFLNYLTGLS